MKAPAFFLALTLSLTAAACDSDDGATGDSSSTTTTTTSAASTAKKVSVTGQWARNSPMVAGNAAIYMKLVSTSDDALVGASISPTLAERAELHETKMIPSASTPMASDSPATVQMVQVDSIALPAGKSVELKPGGFHVMLLNLPKSLEVGQEFHVTLQFEHAPDEVIHVPVRSDAP